MQPMSKALLFISAQLLPHVAGAEIYNFSIQGPATVSVNGGSSTTETIQINAVTDLAFLSSGLHAGSLFQSGPLANLSLSGPGISGGVIQPPGEFSQVVASPGPGPTSFSIAGITLLTSFPLDPFGGRGINIPGGIACLDCASSLSTIFNDVISFQFSSGQIGIVGIPAVPEPPIVLLVAAGIVGLRIAKKGRAAI